MSERIEIGYLCYKGHFQFSDDPDGDSCGTKNVATIYVEPNEWIDPPEIALVVAEALTSLHNKIEFWRHNA